MWIIVKQYNTFEVFIYLLSSVISTYLLAIIEVVVVVVVVVVLLQALKLH